MLVDYSDSESDSESKSVVPTPAPPAPEPSAPAKPSFGLGLAALLPKPKSREKGAAASDGPTKIVVNLPKVEDDDLDEPPSKKFKTSGVSLNDLLPAPKNSGVPATNADAESTQEKKKKDEDRIEKDRLAKEGWESVGDKGKKPAASTMFVPQSVARKPIQPMSAFKKSSSAAPKKEVVKPKMSLFGSGVNLVAKPKPSSRSSVLAPAAEYKPIMLETTTPASKPEAYSDDEEDAVDDGPAVSGTAAPYATGEMQGPQDLEAIAREAGLDESAMRQLYGRKGRNAPVEIATFNVDAEYSQNATERALGLAEEVKPVRSIAPGRHQLQSLLNVAQSQKTALEDSFAQGKRNRREAGSRYGW